jgi:hypothetical protein
MLTDAKLNANRANPILNRPPHRRRHSQRRLNYSTAQQRDQNHLRNNATQR